LSRVAKRYVRALFGLAVEKQSLDAVESDLEQIGLLLESSAEFRSFLSNPLIGDPERLAVVRELFENKVQPITFQFLHLLSDKKRLDTLPDVVQIFKKMLLQRRQIVEGELISAVELESAQEAAIRKQMETMIGKQVKLTRRIDPGILGGFVLRFEDVVIDNSVRNQLIKLREKLIAG
jgi:F-type H+-transporting ATPase subunit delta